MRVIETIADMKKARADLAGPVGLVPTMGYLHEGHLTLARRARDENASVVATIFVNPTQFGPQEDFASYPRDASRDLELLAREKTDIVFMPSACEMYPGHYDTWVEVGTVTSRLEGVARPGHFRGVATVCNKLFNITQPARAYFGEKDAQQVLVIKKMAAELNLNLEIITVATVREADGLAMSSRNSYLNPEERKAAAVLYRSLSLARRLYSEGEKDAGKLRRVVTEMIEKEPLARIDYVSIAGANNLDELEVVTPPALVLLAVRIGKTRLIDNITL